LVMTVNIQLWSNMVEAYYGILGYDTCLNWHTGLLYAVEGTIYKMQTSNFASTTDNNLVHGHVMAPVSGTHLPIISETDKWKVAYWELARLPVASGLWNWLLAWFIGLQAFIPWWHGTVAVWCWEDPGAC
jgi:hypothetical protein